MNNQIVMKSPAELKPRKNNARTHSKKQINQIANSIKEFGFLNPILIDGDNYIIAGHGRLEGAKAAGLASIPTLRVDHLSPAQLRAYVIADNRVAENAGWDREILALELNELQLEGLDGALMGFNPAEIEALFAEFKVIGDQNADEAQPPADRAIPAISRPGDLWMIGKHRLLCGDATKIEDFQKLLAGEKAQCVFTDPPYNVPIQGNVSGLGKNQHREFAMASGEMTKPAFTGFLTTVFRNLASVSADGSIHFACMDWRHLGEMLEAGQAAYSELKNLCVWAKTNAGMGSLYRSQHELVFVFKAGKAEHINNVQLGANGRNRTNIWTYPGVNTFGNSRDAELAMHPTVKPVALVADAILDCSNRDGIVLDAFTGSGSTLIAAENTGRRGYGLEIDPYYVDTIIRRFAGVSEAKAVLAGTANTFEEVLRAREAERGLIDA